MIDDRGKIIMIRNTAPTNRQEDVFDAKSAPTASTGLLSMQHTSSRHTFLQSEKKPE